MEDGDEAVGDNDRWRIASERNFDLLLLLHLRHTLLLNMIVIVVIIVKMIMIMIDGKKSTRDRR